jgi:pimeloyl-ACP methyl ester carboxylesterase
MAPVARGLADDFRVIEPFQRAGGAEPLTVMRHVADLHEVVSCSRPCTLVGHSWGAMLVLAWAAAYPESARSLVLIGSGTFDAAARAEFQRRVDRRAREVRPLLVELRATIGDRDERLARAGALLLPAYSCDLVSNDLEVAAADARSFDETWSDMLRCQEAGEYPAAFTAIECPVLMLHGDVDPHPGAMIYDSLKPHLRRLEYRELQRCGHYPWLELHARVEFFSVLRDWLARHG